MASAQEQQLHDEIRRLRAELEQLRATTATSEAPAPSELNDASEDSELRYRSVIAALSEGVVLQAQDGAILACNQAAEEILGLSVDQMMGRTSTDPRWQAIHPDGSEFAGADHPAMVTLQTGEPQRNIPMGVHKPDGSLTWISINSQPLIRADADLPHAVVTTFTDVTEFRSVQHALERSARQLRIALSSARAGVWDWDIGTNEIWWSDGVEALFGLEPGEFDGAFETYRTLVHPQDREHVFAEIQRVLSSDDPNLRYEIEHRVETEDGELRWVYASGAVLRDDSGEPTSMTGAVLDITESKDLEQRLIHSQKMESVGRLAGGVAHDFNNLLTAILVSAEFALDELDDPDALRDHLETIHHAGQQGSRLTRQLLSFARKQVLTLAPLRVGEVVAGCHKMIARLLGEHIELELHCSDEALVNADPGQLEQVVVNLAVNARDAMPEGGELTVSVDELTLDERPGPHVRLRVSDTGAGIEPELLAKVFDPFFTTKQDGSGLGLATCHGIVTQLGGQLHIDSEPGHGTTVEVLLPATKRKPKAGPASEPTPARGEETLLVVEDDDRVRKLTHRALGQRGYTLLEADSPKRALDIAASYDGDIHLLISDVLMPGMSGPVLAETLVAIRPETRVLLVSGYSEQPLASTLAGRELQFLQKPYSTDELSRRVRQILDDEP